MKILIIDNHSLFRDGLRFLLQHSPIGFDEILEADNFYTGLFLVEQNPDIDIVLLEIKSPGCHYSTSIEQFHKRYPDIPLVVVSSEESGSVIYDALKKGARGYVCKSFTSKILQGALAHVISGGIFIPSQMIGHTNKVSSVDFQNNCSTPSLAGNRLTTRQMQVLNHIAAGLSTKHVANSMGLAEGTVRVHVASIFQTFHVNNRAQAILVANNLGLFKPRQTSAFG